MHDLLRQPLFVQELQRSHVLPPAMSAAERKNIYKELVHLLVFGTFLHQSGSTGMIEHCSECTRKYDPA